MTKQRSQHPKAQRKYGRLILNGYFLTGEKNLEKRAFFLKNKVLLESFKEVIVLERSHAFSASNALSPSRELRQAKALMLTKCEKVVRIPFFSSIRRFCNSVSNFVKRLSSKKIPLRSRMLIHRYYFSVPVAFKHMRRGRSFASGFAKAAQMHKRVVQLIFFPESVGQKSTNFQSKGAGEPRSMGPGNQSVGQKSTNLQSKGAGEPRSNASSMGPGNQSSDYGYKYFPNELTSGACSIWELIGGVIHLFSPPKYDCWNTVTALERQIPSGKSDLWNKFIKRLRLYGSFRYITHVFSELELDDSDVVIVFSEHSSGARILLEEARSCGSLVLITEYGEIPGTFSVSEKGLFHESWPGLNPTRFNQFPISGSDREAVQGILSDIAENRRSTKTFDSNSGNQLENTEDYDLVIYVNGVQPFMSGLSPRCSDFSLEYSPHFSSNIDVLAATTRVAENHNWLVLYKDHPNIVRALPKACVPRDGWGDHVRILDNVNIHDVLAVSDIMVSLGSKSVFLSLACNLPVVLVGPYSINTDNLNWGVNYMLGGTSSEQALESAIYQIISGPSGVDKDGLIDYLSRMMSYDLYEYNAKGQFNRGASKFSEDLHGLIDGTRASLTDIPELKEPIFPESKEFNRLWHLQTDLTKWKTYAEDEIECLSEIFEKQKPRSIVDWGCGLARSAVCFFRAFDLQEADWTLCDLSDLQVSEWVSEDGKKIGKGMGTFDHSDPLPYNDLGLTMEFCRLNGMKRVEVRDLEAVTDIGSPDLFYSLHCVGYHFSIKAFLDKVAVKPKTMVFGIRKRELEGAYDVVDINDIAGYRRRVVKGRALQDFLIFEKR
tara:strand:+ start:1240 stop:3729 length:2490 start_codon:yes stop_codon:yes gene_type:complete